MSHKTPTAESVRENLVAREARSVLFEHEQFGKITSVTTGFTTGNTRTVLEVEVYSYAEKPGPMILLERIIRRGRTPHLTTALAWIFEPLPDVVAS